MSDDKKVNIPLEEDLLDNNAVTVSTSEISSNAGSVRTTKTPQRASSSSDRQLKFERAQKALENAALVSKRIKEHRKATAELLGRPFEDDDAGDTASEMASTMSERTDYSVATDTSTTLSVKEALNIPGISESLANTLKQKELLMERIKQYKEISKRPSLVKASPVNRKDLVADVKKATDNCELTQLLNSVKEKDHLLNIMQVKMKAMETTILDLQEKINEKDQIIEAKNIATSLMSDSLSKKEKDSVLLLEDTKQQMIKMQENFITIETEWKEERQRMLKELELRDEKIKHFEEANTILENSRFEISIAHSKLTEELQQKNTYILELQEKLETISQMQIENTPKEQETKEEEKGSKEISNMEELTKKIELLEQLNCQIRQTNKELENKLSTMNEPKVQATSSPVKKGSPLPSRKGKNVASKMKSPWSNLSSESLPQDSEKKSNKNETVKLEMLVKSLNKDILDKEYIIAQKNELISELQSLNLKKDTSINELQMERKGPSPNTVDIGVSTAEENLQLDKGETTPCSEGDNLICLKELKEKLEAAEQQIEILNSDIDTANKNMVKVKSNHKFKIKQMQKTIDNFSKVSEANAEIVKLNEELHQLTQKVAELEEEKGNLQLHLVDYDSGRLTETDIYKKMIEMENLAEARLKAISLLETQKFDLVQELHVLQQKYVEMEDKLADISQFQNEHVCSEMKSVQLEEQVDELIAAKKELELIIENLKLDKDQLSGTINVLQEEKEDILHKLENYIQENIELTDKLEKLSAEKVSSAESIEIVESLTTQEKLELEEYNKGKLNEPAGDDFQVTVHQDKTTENLIQQNSDLTKKIELFAQERQEVMEKLNKINCENDELLKKIETLNAQCTELKGNVELLMNEKRELQNLSDVLNQQLEELKRERMDILTETVEIIKPNVIDDTTDSTSDLHQDEKSTVEKGGRTKSVKQLTKEILKLKNTIKEREAEIADCQMKILSLEEYQQKQNELMQTNSSFEMKMKLLIDENQQLKKEIDSLDKDKETEKELVNTKNAHKALQAELQKVHQEYISTVTVRDSRINELESILLEYEKQIYNYNDSIQQKDKELIEYINQITKLNDVSQKLKSTIELLEEEKLKDPNAELVKSLNKQITAYQKKLSEYEEKLRILEDEKTQFLSLKSSLEGKNNNLDIEFKKLQETYVENQTLINELQGQQQKHEEEVANVRQQAVERDVEIHDIKLQLRKESIENEKLRTNLSQRDKDLEDLVLEHEETIKKFSDEKDKLKEQYDGIEHKNKELIEKLKKFAVNIKKKSSMYIELENQLSEAQKQLQLKNEQIEQLAIQVETLPALQEKVKHAEEEINRLLSQKMSIEQQKSHDITQLLEEVASLEDQLTVSSEDIIKSNESINLLHKELHFTREENINLKSQLDALQNKLVEHEIEQKNHLNFITKIASLEADINQKQQYISDLLRKIENQEQQLKQLQFGHDAKVQERDLFIENLETEISKYKNRICRLEESISVMEERRHSLERKADQLDNQLREKQKAYVDYSSQEDELVARLAVLMDHDRVIEKQLHEIESDNKELQFKIQHTNEENQRLRKALSDIQDHCNTLMEKASRTDSADAETHKYQSQVHDLENSLKRLTLEHQTLLVQRKQDIEDLEMEFNTQIENAIKEKKSLSEKYEKINEHVSRLELKLQEYRNNIENLNINLEELNKINQELVQKSTSKDEGTLPDYTEQYINEINKLNSSLNYRNHENNELHNKIQSIQNNNIAVISTLENKILDLQTTLENMSTRTDQLNTELNNARQHNKQLQDDLMIREEVIKDLKEKKTVTFEMNIPKTEGMIISSTIEALTEAEQSRLDMSSLESQIISDTNPEPESKNTAMKVSEYFESTPSVKGDNTSKSIEPEIVPRKTYLCYKAEESTAVDADPFNSDEGWGLGDSEESKDMTSDISQLNKKILDLKIENEKLKNDIDTSNAKLFKALKKLKDLKTNNDMLSKELTLSKQISQSSLLDTAIEDELRNNIQELENKIDELKADLIKERKDKETVKKQNEVFSTANDRLTDMKEKMDNEVELWKFKFKEVNDKLSSLHWEDKDSPAHKMPMASSVPIDDALKDEITKLEKENEELQQTLDQLTEQNKELSIKQLQMINEIDNLQNKLQICNSDKLNDRVLELQHNNDELSKSNELLKNNSHNLEVRFNELTYNYDQLLGNKEEMQSVYERDIRNLSENCLKLEDNVKSLTASEIEANDKVKTLTNEVDLLKQSHEEVLRSMKLQGEDSLLLSEKCNDMENQCSQLKTLLASANNKVNELESFNEELLKKIDKYDELLSNHTQQIREYEDKIDDFNDKLNQEVAKSITNPEQITGHEEHISELNAKLEKLNIENDQLLSTVTELRSSVASAVDQRGFEISELWKQHLAQREADFQKTEQELRTELSASESKYEQLLDSVQSSTQEETNKLVMIEQVTSLQHKLLDKEEHLRNLQDKYAEVMSQLDVLRSEIEDEKIMHDNKLLTQQDEYEKIIHELRIKNHLNAETSEESVLKSQAELIESKTRNELLTQHIEELNNKITESERRVLDLSNEIQIKDSEIYQKTLEYGHTLSQRNEEFENVRKQLIEYEKKLEEISYEKESELAILRLKMHDNNEHHEKIQKDLKDEKLSLAEALNEKIVECTNLNKQITQLNQSLEEHLNRATEMQMALENQEVEIVTLKDEIDDLQKEIKISSSKIEKHVTFASDTKPGAENETPESELNTELLDAVPRAELDLALYMLHQRDVRCEELTMELTQLLEERDTLQLRLSDSLRSNEELKSRCKVAGLDESFSLSEETAPEMPSLSTEKEQQFVDIHRGQTSRSSSMSDPDGDKPKLQAKLSELRTVKHSRDVRFRQESEQRQLDLRLLQRDVANLPPEAIDQLAQAHHTLSRDSQSTSTVLLNWLRGKSTPKVVHM